MSVTLTFDQEWYLNTHYMFYRYPEDVAAAVPADFTIKARIRTFDPVSGSEVYDRIDLTVVSNGEDWSAMCADAFAALAIDSSSVMSGERTWDVPAADI